MTSESEKGLCSLCADGTHKRETCLQARAEQAEAALARVREAVENARGDLMGRSFDLIVDALAARKAGG